MGYLSVGGLVGWVESKETRIQDHTLKEDLEIQTKVERGGRRGIIEVVQNAISVQTKADRRQRRIRGGMAGAY